MSGFCCAYDGRERRFNVTTRVVVRLLKTSEHGVNVYGRVMIVSL
jgi:hypothetical protein